MKKLLFFAKDKLLVCLLLTLFSPLIVLAQPTDPEILASIDLGTAWMVEQQDVDGSWGFEERVAYTGFALTKLCDRAYEHFYDSPFDPDYEYHQQVIDGFNYLFSQARNDLTGIYMAELGAWHQTYNAAVALMAMASSYTPDQVIVYPANPVVDGLTFAQLVDQMIIYFEDGQNDNEPPGMEYGGWGYQYNWGGSDNSHTGYVILGLRYAEAFGATIPQGIKDKLTVWIDYIQNDQGPADDLWESAPDGGSGYSSPDDWVNQLKTGNLLFEMSFFGDAVEDTRVQYALDYIARHWDDVGTGSIFDTGWDGHIQAMFCLMKGFESFDIETIEVSSVERNWFGEFATYLLGAQDPVGFWPGDPWGDELLSTFWALYVLERVAPPPPIVYVDFDIHPTSWPNPINVNSNGLIPTAILGTEEFDVLTIDPATLLLEGVAPVMWDYEDVTMPVEGEDECNDTEEGPDGYLDMTIKFNTQEIVAALGEVSDGQEMVLTITGNLIDDGLDIEGDDCIVIRKKGKGNKYAVEFNKYNLTQNYPNPFVSSTTINFELPNDAEVLLKVYDVYGNEVATLFNQEYPAGIHTVDFDAGNLKGGHYYYSIQTKDYMDVKSMIIIK